MKKIKALQIVFFTLALFASVFLFPQVAMAQTKKPWNVDVLVACGDVCFRYNLENNIQNIGDASNRALFSSRTGKMQLADELLKQQLPPQAVYEYVLPGFENLVEKFRFVRQNRQDATVSFGKNGFTFCQGQDGICVDEQALFFRLLECCGVPQRVILPLKITPAVTVGELQKHTVLKGSFTTKFTSSGPNRCHNVALAAAAIDGTTVKNGETFSFNQTVGKRTAENGYKTSKIISEGKYTDGVGGGVCQVSTTLYNALLLSEIIPNACQHTLVSSYVQAGFDAMVSDGGADLTFQNQTGYDLFLEGKTDVKNKTVTFKVYGVPNTYRVERESVEERIPYQTVEIVDSQKYPQLVYVDQTFVVQSGSDGVQSKSFLNFYDGDTLICKMQIRQNSYKRVDKVVARGYLPR